MTLGQKLAGYRRLSGMTQQQLGDYLNISPQAISKWEKDLSEPALATLRALSELYQVSVDEILDLKSGFPDMTVISNDEEKNENEPSQAATIGYCRECGIAVTEENLATTRPVVRCKSCAEGFESMRKEHRSKDRENLERRYKWSIPIASIGAIVTACIFLVAILSTLDVLLIPIGLFVTYDIFAFIFCLFFDCMITDSIVGYEVDGCLSLVFLIVGVFLLGILLAPFIFPFVLHKTKKELKSD